MSRQAERALPGWPEGLTEDLAAAYLGISVSLFRREWEARRMPRPRRITVGRQVWHRAELKAWLDAQFNLQKDPPVRTGLTPKERWDQICGFGEAPLS